MYDEFDELVAPNALKIAVVLRDANETKFLVFVNHVLLVDQGGVVTAVEVEIQDMHCVGDSRSGTVIAGRKADHDAPSHRCGHEGCLQVHLMEVCLHIGAVLRNQKAHGAREQHGGVRSASGTSGRWVEVSTKSEA